MRVTITASDIQYMSGLIEVGADPSRVILAKMYEERSAFWVGLGPQVQKKWDEVMEERGDA